MESENVNSVLVSWKGTEKNVFLLYNEEKILVVNGYAVIWAKAGSVYFQFSVNGTMVIADHYPKKLKNGIFFNYIEVEPLPEEFAQIKFLSLQEIEIIDQEVFGPRGCDGKVEKIQDYFQEAAQKIVSLLKMNVCRNKYRRVLRNIRIIQKWIRSILMRKKKFIRIKKIFCCSLKGKLMFPGKSAKSRTLTRIVQNFQEFREGLKKKPKFYQLNIRVGKSNYLRNY